MSRRLAEGSVIPIAQAPKWWTQLCRTGSRHTHGGLTAAALPAGAAALLAVLAACSEGGSLPLPTFPTMPSLPQLPPFPSLPTDAPEFPGSSTSVYTRVARGANICWFGPNGGIDRTYIWFARAEPESKGGLAEIVIHERVDKNQRGLKVFGVTIAPRGEGAAVSAQNFKMPGAIGQRMIEDAYRWARGGVGCAAGDTSWSPVVPVIDAKADAKAKPKSGARKAAKTASGKDSAAKDATPKDPASKQGVPTDAAAKSAPALEDQPAKNQPAVQKPAASAAKTP